MSQGYFKVKNLSELWLVIIGFVCILNNINEQTEKMTQDKFYFFEEWGSNITYDAVRKQ
ncbi:hypothetical protein [Peribacillus sp. TH14]|uniref:hypothetical protein n=1 Tax=Peribacillus sp. TH14 TaxID=2798481 RepID=UPI001913C97C|nr:hypothetical protein [Peribacillus sp. TH14]MBK5499549.1 hypothetical protein [Peribacillus sp. TH14]